MCWTDGPVPSVLARLTRLEALDLSWNRLAGFLPDYFELLPAFQARARPGSEQVGE